MKADKIIDDIARDFEVALRNLLEDNFNSQSFFGDKWQSASPLKRAGQALLFQRGDLRRSLRISRHGDTIRVTSSVPYANIHNEGGRIEITDKMRRYFLYRAHLAYKSKQKKQARIWGSLARGKKTLIVIPKRQFIGKHKAIDQALAKIATCHLNRYKQELINQLKK